MCFLCQKNIKNNNFVTPKPWGRWVSRLFPLHAYPHAHISHLPSFCTGDFFHGNEIIEWKRCHGLALPDDSTCLPSISFCCNHFVFSSFDRQSSNNRMLVKNAKAPHFLRILKWIEMTFPGPSLSVPEAGWVVGWVAELISLSLLKEMKKWKDV